MLRGEALDRSQVVLLGCNQHRGSMGSHHELVVQWREGPLGGAVAMRAAAPSEASAASAWSPAAAPAVLPRCEVGEGHRTGLITSTRRPLRIRTCCVLRGMKALSENGGCASTFADEMARVAVTDDEHTIVEVGDQSSNRVRCWGYSEAVHCCSLVRRATWR